MILTAAALGRTQNANFTSHETFLVLLLQEFLKKEFSEENILFWQACECFSHVPATDKKQVSAATDVH